MHQGGDLLAGMGIARIGSAGAVARRLEAVLDRAGLADVERLARRDPGLVAGALRPPG